MSKQGRMDKNQPEKKLKMQAGENNIEMSSEFRVGNSQSQSQKKSGRQINKK